MLTLQIPLNSDGKNFEFDLNQERVTIGRRHDNDVRIKETYVSAYHAEFARADDGLILCDRDSANGTYVNGERIKGKVEVNEGDKLRFGSLSCFLVEKESPDATPTLTAISPERAEIIELKALLSMTQDELKTSRAEALRISEIENEKADSEAKHVELKANELQEVLNLTDTLTEEKNRSLGKVDSLSAELSRLKEEFNHKQTIDDLQADRISSLEQENRLLRDENQLLKEKNTDLNHLKAEIGRSSQKVESLQGMRSNLEKDAQQLRAEKDQLAKGAKTALQEMEICEKTYQEIKNDCEFASHKLDTISQQLQDSEKKVRYLRDLEAELEKSVKNAQHARLSRKCIYSDQDDSDIMLLPEAEQLICREIIERIELLEDLLKRYQQGWLFPKFTHQLQMLRDSFMTLLNSHSVDEFDFKPGTELSVDERRKIQLISAEDFGDPKLKKKSERFAGKRTTVLETIRPGYIYSKDGRDVIIRKAEVIVA